LETLITRLTTFTLWPSFSSQPDREKSIGKASIHPSASDPYKSGIISHIYKSKVFDAGTCQTTQAKERAGSVMEEMGQEDAEVGIGGEGTKCLKNEGRGIWWVFL
jgi:hypothetical protein